MSPSFQKLAAEHTGSLLVTGVAGFIGFHVTKALLELGKTVIGVDALNAYYDPQLKMSRRDELVRQFPDTFHFHQALVQDRDAMAAIWAQAHPKVTHVIHLAAQAGVRYSLEDPYSYVDTNVMGHLVMLELARHHRDQVKNFVYASTSSVYGANEKIPFSEMDVTESPMAVYAATKKCDELMSQAYAHLFRLPIIGLRFFSVYGPWGRPDQALFIFTKNILENKPIPVFNRGEMKRDFTYVGDIVNGVVAALATPLKDDDKRPPHTIYNLGSGNLRLLNDYIALIEKYLERSATKELLPMQPGDVPAALADIRKAQKDLGFAPHTSIEEGVKNFVDWYRGYYGK